MLQPKGERMLPLNHGLATARTDIRRAVFCFLATLVALCLMAASDARPNPLADLPLAKPGEVGSGSLLLRPRDGAEDTPHFRVAPTVATEVEIDAGGLVARAKVRQHFHNPGAEWVEGVYVFPLPENAAVDHLRLIVGDRLIEGIIKERQEARRVYEQARREGRKASLLESERPNIFTTSIANIGPGEQVAVEIEYQQVLRYDQGTFSLRFPMVVGPRYIPGEIQSVSLTGNGFAVDATDRVPDAGRITSPVLRPEEGKINPVALTVTLAAGFPLADIKSGYHPVDIADDESGAMRVTLAEGAVPADRDFELTWRPEASAAPVAGLFTEQFDGAHYLLAMILPPDPAAAEDTVQVPPREVIFVLDISGSMAGASIEQAKAALALAIDRLSDRDRFNLVIFNHAASALFNVPRPAEPAQRAMARQFVEALDADGGTEMAPALTLALRGRPPAGTLRQVVFLTDGSVGNETELFDIIDAGLGSARLFTIGIGSAPNSYFMVKAAETGRGTFTHIGSTEEVQERMTALFEKLEAPAMTDLAMTWPDDIAPSLSRDTLPDLYAGEPVMVSARVDRLDGALGVSGLRDGVQWRATLDLKDAAPAKGMATLWARERIGALMHQRGFDADPETIRQDVLKLALKHHLVSKYTSLVAVDLTPSRPAGEPLASGKLPHNLPHGWDFDKVFGQAKRAMPAPLDQDASLPRLTPASADNAVGIGTGIALPQGATPAGLQALIGLLLIMLSMAMIGVWRVRRA